MFKCFFHHHNLEYNFREKTGVCRNCGAKLNFGIDTTDQWAGIPDKDFFENHIDNFLDKHLPSPKDEYWVYELRSFTDMCRWKNMLLTLVVFLLGLIITGSAGWGLFWALLVMLYGARIR